MKRSDFEIEICANSIQSVIAAAEGGADRVELCDNLYEGGTTPSIGLQTIAKESALLKIYPIIRPRGGDFLYSEDEIKLMIYDISELGKVGADGFVIGCLTADGKVDYENISRLIEACKGKPVTFHRAFDMTNNPFESLETCKKLGISRILTSGQKNKAVDGIPILKELVNLAGDNIKIMAGSGIDENNIVEIAKKTNVRSFHLSARNYVESRMIFRRSDIYMGGLKEIPEFGNKFSDLKRIKPIIDQVLQFEE